VGPKVSGVVVKGSDQEISALGQCNGKGIYYEKVSACEKILQGFPCFLHLKILKRAFLGDMKLWGSRHCHRRHRYRLRHRLSQSREKRKRDDAKSKC
jgi:hypothetical protein